MRKDSILVAVEGIDGVGKSSAVPVIAETLRSVGYDTITTREPYTEEVCKAVHETTSISPMELYDMMLKDRREHVYDVILPHLSSPDKAVVTDRYMYSCIAYNSSEELEPWMILQEHQVNTIPESDILILMDMEVRDAQERMYKNRGFVEEFEARTMQRAQNLFRTVFDTHSCSVYVNASKDLEKVHEDIRFKVQTVCRLMQLRSSRKTLSCKGTDLWNASEKSYLIYQESIPYRITVEDHEVRIIKGSAAYYQSPVGMLRASTISSTHTVLIRRDPDLMEVSLILSPMDMETFEFLFNVLEKHCGQFDHIILL